MTFKVMDVLDMQEIQTELKEVNENKLKDNVKQMEELNELSKSKDNLINTQNDTIKMYQDKINEYKKTKIWQKKLMNIK